MGAPRFSETCEHVNVSLFCGSSLSDAPYLGENLWVVIVRHLKLQVSELAARTSGERTA